MAAWVKQLLRCLNNATDDNTIPLATRVGEIRQALMETSQMRRLVELDAGGKSVALKRRRILLDEILIFNL